MPIGEAYAVVRIEAYAPIRPVVEALQHQLLDVRKLRPTPLFVGLWCLERARATGLDHIRLCAFFMKRVLIVCQIPKVAGRWRVSPVPLTIVAPRARWTELAIATSTGTCARSDAPEAKQ